MIRFPGLAWCYAGIVGAAIVVAGCSGGGGSSAPTPRSPLPTQAPIPNSTAFKQSATAVITFPHGAPPGSKRNYVSPNSTSISVTINTVNGSTPPPGIPTQVIDNLTFSGPGQNCTVSNGLATCAVTIPAPPGNVNYTIATYGSPAPTPSSTATPNPSPTPITPVVLDETEETVVIKQGVPNQVNVTLQGIVKFAIVTPASPLISGTTSSSVLTVTAMDASGAVITGTKPFVGPFKFSDSDRYGTNNPLYEYSTFLEVNGVGPPSKAVQIFSPLDVVTMIDYGVAQGQFKVGATGPGQLGVGPVQGESEITPVLQPVVLPGIVLDDQAHGGLPTDPNYNQYTLFMHVGDPVYTISPTESGWTNAPYGHCESQEDSYTCFALADVTNVYTPCNDSPNPVAMFSPGPFGEDFDNTWTIMAEQPGLCLQQFYDANAPGHNPAPQGNPLVNGELWVKVQ